MRALIEKPRCRQPMVNENIEKKASVHNLMIFSLRRGNSFVSRSCHIGNNFWLECSLATPANRETFRIRVRVW